MREAQRIECRSEVNMADILAARDVDINACKHECDNVSGKKENDVFRMLTVRPCPRHDAPVRRIAAKPAA